MPDFLARVQMAEFMALPADVYSRRSVSDAQKTVREQVREHGRLVLCEVMQVLPRELYLHVETSA